ncbi:MAG TPA: phosphoribosylglycinamide formyltransferase [Bacteroidia bacterium]|nr:phosphoribosylglycinamide formyltransferase [Bacteroidia bacterium]
MKNLAIFASGEGTNAENLINYFKDDSRVKIKLIITNNEKAGVIAHAEKYRKNVQIISKKALETYTDQIIEFLKVEKIDLIVLAGFLLKIPVPLIHAFPNKIINIHPSLLPKFGGKGMYGHHVHEAVLAAREKTSGITVHFVNEEYDKGKVILQLTCAIEENETTDSLSAKIRKLEFEGLPAAIETLL